MQEAIPYKSWQSHLSLPSITYHNNQTVVNEGINDNIVGKATTSKIMMINDMISENPVMVMVRRGCCMGYVVNHLLLGHGVNPTVYEVEEKDEYGLIQELHIDNSRVDDQNRNFQFPLVFIGGTLFGGLDRVMAAHITGELVPLLKQAGALWL